MDVQIGKLTPIAPTTAPVRTVPTVTPEAVFALPDKDTVHLTVPTTPPREALDEVAKASEIADKLHSDNRELHFEMDKDSKRVIIQVKDLDGRVIRTIPPSEALGVMSGDTEL
jgi:flagellar protein FlaG